MAAKRTARKKAATKKVPRKKGAPRKAAAKRRTGRPKKDPLVDPAVADALVEWLSIGKTLRSFCRQEGMPSRRTIDDWRAADEEFSARVARAREDGFEELAEECVEIADDHEEHPLRSRLRVDTRMKLLACWDPRRYGNKVSVDSKSEAKVEHSGRIEGGGPPLPDPEAFAAHLAQIAQMGAEMVQSTGGEDDD